MESFIEEVVATVLKQNDDVTNTLFIVPSRRAGNMVRSALSQKLNKTIFAPEIFSIEEFIAHISGLRAIDATEQLFTLFKVYQEKTPKVNQESFAVFYGWAQTVLHDFNEIDRYLVSHKEFFDYLSAVQEINHWSSENNQTDIIKRYLDFWETLPVLYKAFCTKLEKQGKGHQGIIYRKAADDVEFYIENNKDKQHIFIGFNALNTSEQHIIQALLSAGNTSVFWDAEEWFMKNKKHEASYFLRAYKKEWKYYQTNPFLAVSNNYPVQKNIRSIAVTQDIEQAKLVGQLLQQYTSSKELRNTAVILNDERLLIPILNALPDHIKKVNITMGVPLGQTPTAALFDQLFLLHTHVSQRGYYYKQVVAILQHQAVGKLLGSNLERIKKTIASQNYVYFSEKEIKTMILQNTESDIVASLFTSWDDNPNNAIKLCLTFIQGLKESLLHSDHKEALALEYLFGFYKVFNQLKNLNDTYAFIEDVATLRRFYMDVIGSHTLDLRGDPYEGLQIMGVLESRLLDFKNIIMTSVNEGVIPAGKSTNSYIPYDLKLTYKLPTFREKDAVYAYHFYRLLHRANNVDFIYTTSSQGIGSTEKSRFILQMEIEGPHDLASSVATSSFQVAPYTENTILKTPEIISRLREIVQSGLSPSSLTTYIRNPIDFYYKYVLRIKEREDVEETVAANTMGTIVHNTLEELYKPYVNVKLTAQIIEGMILKIDAEVRNQFATEYGLTQIAQGKNLIIYQVVCRYVENYLQLQLSSLKSGDTIVVRGLESNLNVSFKKEINFKGKVDLVEERNGDIRIIDYKTGKVESRHLSPANWEDLLDDTGKYEKAFQVLMYAYMMHKKTPLALPISAGIISFKNLKSGFMPFKKDKSTDITEETLSSFSEILDQLIAEILNPDIPFAQPT
ncbi:PD-(D/E)XK nuclease family protein [Dokdonia sinensis]|uniref:PD-(D/E)XK nuclease family protein n=1 Tax=Dokdonia sinensis TaxID=2479847 RepID=A0A3M0GEW1_9FLAO|nr:PD-(D/E)XK nuclease family protein [Dokdonia sinensis]RMB63294.1 PD-(D/E)XK nuclease family protein [Dokdonia sinensis]